MGAEIARVRLVTGHFLLFDLDLRRRACLRRFHFGAHFPNDFERMHVDVPVRAKLGALAATDAPIFNNDLEIFLASDRTNRALRHAERVPTRSTSGGNEEMIVAQTIPEQARHAIVRLGTGADAGIAARTIVQVDEQKILRFKQALI